MLGSGRPFLIEVLNVRAIPTAVEVQQIADKINSSEKKYVRSQIDAGLTLHVIVAHCLCS
jgi:tRNA U54 and U55 pseudouridine synthase Pus10